MNQKVLRVGKHSLAVVIPAYFVHETGIRPGDDVMVETITSENVVKLKFTNVLQLLLPTENKVEKK